MAHKNIPVFIPHLGCPNMCVFCNQRSISGKIKFERDSVYEIIENALKTINPEKDEVQIAFFGGSFTGIDRQDMIFLLSAAKKYIDKGLVNSVRLSTRPDYINREILDILRTYGVRSIELGIQSLSDDVLRASKRGHTAEISENACRLIKEYGFELVGQMMLGLPCSTEENEIMTAEKLCLLGVDAVRIYPTAVFSMTELDEMMENGNYRPLTPREGAKRAGRILLLLDKYKVECIRCGLQAQDNLSDPEVITGGAYHPAFGSMARGEAIREVLIQTLAEENFEIPKFKKQIRFALSPDKLADASGYKKENKIFFLEKYNIHVKFIGDEALHGYECRLLTKN